MDTEEIKWGGEQDSNLRTNRRRGNQTAAEFGHPEVEAQAKRLLRSATAVNATRWVNILRGRLQSCLGAVAQVLKQTDCQSAKVIGHEFGRF